MKTQSGLPFAVKWLVVCVSCANALTQPGEGELQGRLENLQFRQRGAVADIHLEQMQRPMPPAASAAATQESLQALPLGTPACSQKALKIG